MRLGGNRRANGISLEILGSESEPGETWFTGCGGNIDICITMYTVSTNISNRIAIQPYLAVNSMNAHLKYANKNTCEWNLIYFSYLLRCDIFLARLFFVQLTIQK